MSHLSDDQLSARLDASGAADASAADAADRHLADCAECRERLAALSELDASLKGALAHDPGDAYFASFADRVTARIAAAPAEAPARAAQPARSSAGGGGFFGWLLSPRGLTLAGSMAGVAVVAALAYVLTRDGGADRFAQQVAPKSEVGAAADATPPAETPSAPAPAATATQAAPVTPSNEADAQSPPQAARKEAAAPAPVERRTTAARAQEVRTDAAGEPVAVQKRALPPAPALSAPATPSSGPVRVQKPQSATPMGSTLAQRAPETAESAAPAAPAAPAPTAARSTPQATTFAAPPAASSTPAPAPTPPAPAPAPAKPRFDVSKLFEKAKSSSSGTTPAPATTQSQSQGFAAPPTANDATAPSVTAPVTPPMSAPSLEGKGARGGRATETNFRASAYDMAAGRAREAEAIAARTHAAADWDRAASAWRQAALVANEPAQERASRRAESEARMTAWRTEPNELRRMAARAAVRGWLAVAEPGAEQDAAKKLEAELGR